MLIRISVYIALIMNVCHLYFEIGEVAAFMVRCGDRGSGTHYPTSPHINELCRWMGNAGRAKAEQLFRLVRLKSRDVCRLSGEMLGGHVECVELGGGLALRMTVTQ